MKDNEERITKEILYYILEQIHEAIHIVDNDGTMIYANRAAEVMECVPKEQMVGKSITDIYTHTDYEKGSLPPSLIVLETGIPRINENCEYYSKDGEIVNSIVSNYPYTSKDENGVSMVCSVSENINQMKERLIRLGGINNKNTFCLRKKLMKNGTVYIFDDIIGESTIMKNTIETAKRFAAKKTPVMLYGETGTGKEMFAQSIHNASPTMHHHFVPINCAAIPENLLESILFGTVKGAFTGALDKEGLFEKAKGGTIFLDEINSMPIGLQAKILRVLQEKEVRRIGDNTTRSVDCRIISALNKQPFKAIQDGELREDLFYRLSTGIIFVPPLRERGGDIALLSRYFMESCNEDFGNHIYQISPELQNLLAHYAWPGNTRELSNTIESAMNMTAPGEMVLTVSHLPAYLKNRLSQGISSEAAHVRVQEVAESHCADLTGENRGLKGSIESFEQYLIVNALKETRGNIRSAAASLHLTRQGLERKLKKYKIEAKQYR